MVEGNFFLVSKRIMTNSDVLPAKRRLKELK